MDFETSYAQFMEKHKIGQHGGSLRGITEGHKLGERWLLDRIWWPAIHNLDKLYPEFDGFNSHAKDISRAKFSDNLVRQNHLILDGWKVLRFSYDEVRERPKMCQQLLQQFMGRWVVGKKAHQVSKLSAEERDILRLALRRGYIVRPKDVCQLLAVEQQKARKLLHNLCTKKLLTPTGTGTDRVFSYRLDKSVTTNDLGI